MGMRFLGKLRKQLGVSSMYKMAELLGMINNSYIYLEKKAKGCELQTLVDIKEKCGLSWSDLGKLIEDEVKEKSKKKS
jgi:hypothetical protein